MAEEVFHKAAGALLHELEERARRVILGDDSFNSIPEAERTGPHDEIAIVASGENWTQYSDGEVLYYTDDGTAFYLE